jgi:hypothetical protein
MKKLFTLGALALMMVGCVEPITISTINPNEGKSEIRISTDMETRVTDTNYEYGDQIGLYVVNEGEYFDTWNTHASNVRFTYDNSTWTPDSPIYWKDKHTRAHFYCYYPYSDVINAYGHNFSVHQDQSNMENYKASEFLWGKAEYQSPTDEAINITTNHKMSKVRLAFKAGKGFTFESLRNSIQSVAIDNVAYSCNINLESGEVSANGDNTSITPLYNESETTNGQEAVVYYALVVPQTVYSGNNIITIRISDDDYKVKLNRDYTFNPGKRHKLNINVDKINNGVNVGVGDWEEDEDEFWGDAE